MVRRTHLFAALVLGDTALAGLSSAGAGSSGARSIELSALGKYEAGIFAGGDQEIVAHDPGTERRHFRGGGARRAAACGRQRDQRDDDALPHRLARAP